MGRSLFAVFQLGYSIGDETKECQGQKVTNFNVINNTGMWFSLPTARAGITRTSRASLRYFRANRGFVPPYPIAPKSGIPFQFSKFLGCNWNSLRPMRQSAIGKNLWCLFLDALQKAGVLRVLTGRNGAKMRVKEYAGLDRRWPAPWKVT